jgi:hypothetical protein
MPGLNVDGMVDELGTDRRCYLRQMESAWDRRNDGVGQAVSQREPGRVAVKFGFHTRGQAGSGCARDSGYGRGGVGAAPVVKPVKHNREATHR